MCIRDSVNAVTRSGSNAFHGNAFYYNRNSATGANDALDKAAGFARPEDALQQFGGGLGGPIRHDRLWFFVDYEQQLRNNPIPVINSALATTPANLPTLLNLFNVPAGTVLPAPSAQLPEPPIKNPEVKPAPKLALAPPALTIPRLTRAPALENFLGMKPEGEIALQMAKVTGFVQRNPHDGEKVSEETDAYLGYDQKNLYLVFVCSDRCV